LLTTLGTPAHYTQVMSGAKELLAAVAQAVTTGLGASSCDVVLVSLTESSGRFATFTGAAELRAAEADGGRPQRLATVARLPRESTSSRRRTKAALSRSPCQSTATPPTCSGKSRPAFEAAVKPQGNHRELGARCESEGALLRRGSEALHLRGPITWRRQ